MSHVSPFPHVLRVASGRFRHALKETRLGRRTTDLLAVRVGPDHAAVVRGMRGGLIARANFDCVIGTSGAAGFFLPAAAERQLLAVEGELEFTFGPYGSRGRVRAHCGGKLLVDHRFDPASSLLRRAPARSGPRIPAGVLAFALRRALAFSDPNSARTPGQDLIVIAPLAGETESSVLLRDAHALFVLTGDAFGAARLQVPLVHISELIAFLRGHETVTIAVTPSPANVLLADDGRALAWAAAAPALTPPPRAPQVGPAVLVEKDAMIRVIDALLAQSNALVPTADLTVRTDVPEMILTTTSGREVVPVRPLRTGPLYGAVYISLQRLRSLCDVVGPHVELSLEGRGDLVVTTERCILNAQGRPLRRPGPASVKTQTFRVMTRMAR